MEKIGNVLAASNLIGGRGTEKPQNMENTTTSSGTPGQDNLLDILPAKAKERLKIMEQVPVTEKTVSKPNECPWGRWNCEYCKDGVRVDFFWEPEPHKIRYHVEQCYQLQRYHRLVKESGLVGIELEHTFERATIDQHNGYLYKYLQRWDVTKGGGIYIVGPNGTGKSYALHALAHRLAWEGVSCLYSRTVDFLAKLRASYEINSQESEDKIMHKYCSVPVLLWDDIGKESFKTEWAPEKFYYVIDYRVRTNKALVISSNFEPETLEKRLGEDNYGPAVVSRLLGYCDIHRLNGPDRRLKAKGVVL